MTKITAQDFQIGAENFFKGVATKGRNALKQANFLVTNTDALSKISKVALAIIGLISTILKAFVPAAGAALDILTKLKVAPGGFVALTNATGIIERLFDFTDPKQLQNISKTWQKLVGRITLTAGQALDTVLFLENMAIVNIGGFGSNMTGNLSIISFVKNAFIAISSVFSIWDAAKTLQEQRKKLSQVDNDSPASQLKKWQEKGNTALAQHLIENKEKYHDLTGVEELKNYKVSKYSSIISNAQKGIKKAWLSIAADAAKLAIVVFSSIALMLIVTAPVALVVMGACGLLAATLGLVKTMYGEFGPKPEIVPANRFIKQDYVKVAQ